MGARSQPREPDEQPTKRLPFAELIELAKLFLSDPANREIEERFAAGCLAEITAVIKAYYYHKRIPNFVFADAVSLAQLNLARGMRDLQYPGELKKWLKRLARNAAVSEFRRVIIGRGGEERIRVPLGTQDAEGKPVETLDLKESREAARRYGAAGSGSFGDFRKKVERQKILGQLLKIHIERAKTRRDRDSAFWIQTLLLEGINLGEPIDEIAKKRGTTRDDVLHLINHDSRALQSINQELSGSGHE